MLERESRHIIWLNEVISTNLSVKSCSCPGNPLSFSGICAGDSIVGPEANSGHSLGESCCEEGSFKGGES